ncbi:MAG: hypothetical protein VXZ35_09750, partial [Pseudomonadota bacterium]|nr:hypothetical protein [Pseudomonadota bacterium]
ITLSGDIVGESAVQVLDSGSNDSEDTDSVEIWGGGNGLNQTDTLHMDVDTSKQQIEYQGTTESFRLNYNGQTTELLSGSSTADQIREALENLSSIATGGVAVIGSGTELDPWQISLLNAEQNAEGKYYKLSSSDNAVATARVSQALVQRLDDNVTAALLAGKPDIDAMFEKPQFSIQQFFVRPDQNSNNPTFTLSYNGEQVVVSLPNNPNDDAGLGKATVEARQEARRQAIETALESLIGIGDVTVDGAGTQRDSWRVEVVDADQDTKGNFYQLLTTDSSVISDPLDIADAAATTAPSLSLADPSAYQRVYYDTTAEKVEIHGGLGDDTIISDDTMAATYVYGDQGADNFLIGRVLETETVTVDGRQIDVVKGDEGITAGVSYNGYFYGGSGDDYFEVNHNIGVLSLFGESGDDTFFLRAHLQSDGTEMDGGNVTAGA